MRDVKRVWVLLVFLLAMGGCAEVGAAQGPATTVQDTVYTATGTPAAGTVVLSWGAFTTAGGTPIPAGSTSVTLGAGGALSVALAPNAGGTPMGSYYTAVFHLSDGTTSKQYWVVPVTVPGGGPAKLAAIQNSVLPTSVAMQTVSKQYVDNAIAQARIGAIPLDSPAYVLKAGDAMTGPLVLPADPVSPLQAADKNYVDENVTAIASGTVSAARLPLFGPSGTGHAAGIVPDPGATAGAARYLREDGTWDVPAGGSGGSGGGVTGSGTTGSFSCWTASGVLGNCHMDDGVTTAGAITSTEPVNTSVSASGIVTQSLANTGTSSGSAIQRTVTTGAASISAMENVNGSGDFYTGLYNNVWLIYSPTTGVNIFNASVNTPYRIDLDGAGLTHLIGGVSPNFVHAETLYSAAGTVLPACNAGSQGDQRVVSDATAPAYMAAYTSGGSVTAAVICGYNGTSYGWLTH